MTELSRRLFLGGAVSLLAASTFSPGPSTANIPRIWGDGQHDDTSGLGALFRRDPVVFSAEKIGVDSHKGIVFHRGLFKITQTIEVPHEPNIKVESATFDLLDLPEEFYALRGRARDLEPFTGLFTSWRTYRGRRSAYYEGDKIVRQAVPARGVPNRRLFLDNNDVEEFSRIALERGYEATTDQAVL